MKKMLLLCGAILFSGSVLAANAPAVTTAASDMSVKTPAIVVSDATVAQVFMDIDNNGNKPHTIIAASSTVAQEVQLHETTHKHGKTSMKQVKHIVIKPRSEDDLKMGGLHVMLLGLKQPLKPGDNVPITLIFADGSSLQVIAPVQ